MLNKTTKNKNSIIHSQTIVVCEWVSTVFGLEILLKNNKKIFCLYIRFNRSIFLAFLVSYNDRARSNWLLIVIVLQSFFFLIIILNSWNIDPNNHSRFSLLDENSLACWYMDSYFNSSPNLLDSTQARTAIFRRTHFLLLQY